MITNHMRPSRYALEVLSAINARHDQLLISNTTPASIPVFVKALGMEAFFNATNALAVNMHVKEVTRRKKDVLQEYVTAKLYEDYVVIGDSASDMDLIDVVGGKAYLYAHTGKPHKSNKGIPIHDLRQVLAEL